MATLPEVCLAQERQMLQSGEMLNQYRIDECLGSGSRGVDYRAYDLRLQRKVALKLLGRKLQADKVGGWLGMLSLLPVSCLRARRLSAISAIMHVTLDKALEQKIAPPLPTADAGPRRE